MPFDLQQLQAFIQTMEGRADELGLMTLDRAQGIDPSRDVAAAVRVLGCRRCPPPEATAPAPRPDPGLLAQLHGLPGVGAVATWWDAEGGELCWRWATAGGFPLRAALSAVFGRGMVQEEPRPAGPCVFQACMLGHPLPVPTPPDRPEPLGLDTLLQALPRQRWSLVVWATPIPRAEVDTRHGQVVEWLRRIHAIPEREQAHPTLVECRELLDRARRHLVERRAQGLWRVAVILMADERETLEVGMAALGGAIPSNPAGPRPLRTHFCRADGRVDPSDEWLGADELARLLQPPAVDWPGFQRVDDVVFDLHLAPARGRRWTPGPALIGGAAEGPDVSVDLEGLTRHALVAGITGAGKTHTLIHLLLAAWQQRIPFLVVEPTKTEYRRLLTLLPPRQSGLRVFTLGLEEPTRAFPLRLNPLDVPPGTPPGTWVDGLMALLQASFVLYPPMPYVLQAALYRVYEAAGWDLPSERRGRVPTMEDLLRACEELVGELGYEQRIAADLRAALRGRLGTLLQGTRGLAYAAGVQVPDAELFDKPCVVELDALPRVEDKAFAMGLLVLRLSCWRRFGPGQGPRDHLTHLLLLEEAHRLLRKAGDGAGGAGQGEGGNPRALGVEQLSDLISEVRAYGQGVIIADQVPSRLAEDALKNTNLKLIHRLVAEDDRELVGRACAMDQAQRDHLVRLGRGQAVLFQEPMDRPVLLQVTAIPGFDGPVPGEEAIVAQWKVHRAAQPKPYTACIECPDHRGPCGPRLAAALRASTAPVLRRRTRAMALAAVQGSTIPGLARAAAPFQPVADLCTRACSARYAARWLGDAVGASDIQVGALERALIAGGDAPWPPQENAGPLAACAACPEPCRWRGPGATLAGDGALWAANLDPPDQLAVPLRPIAERVSAWAGRAEGRVIGSVVFCVAAHEVDSVLLPSVALNAGRVLADRLKKRGCLP